MILIIKTNKEPLHDYEFVKPIETILKQNKIPSKSVHYSKLSQTILNKADKIIISGTSLKDNEFLEHLDKFNFLKTTKKPVLGICAGMQIIALIYGAELKKEIEITFTTQQFEQEFSTKFFEEGETLNGVEYLHNNYTTLPKDFINHNVFKFEYPKAISHKTKPLYGVLFHPEVANHELILNFCNLQ